MSSQVPSAPPTSTTSTIWKLKAGMDRRFRAGHPWVYSNELAESPKGIEPGAPVELRDAAGKFLARGYGNPASLIAFRVLSRSPSNEAPYSLESVSAALSSAFRVRRLAGLADFSFRLCFGEADYLPGLIIDRYLLGHGGQVFVAQAHTAGAQRLLEVVPAALQTLIEREKLGDWNHSALVVRNDLSVRKLEGLNEEPPRTAWQGRGLKGVDQGLSQIQIKPVLGGEALLFKVDLFGGQKTGFFLDQAANIQLAALRLGGLKPAFGKKLRILDLCTYVGQWSAQLSRVYAAQNIACEVLAVDASEKALELARQNIEAEGASCGVVRADVLKDLESLDAQSFDLVISDPPALIKGRKDIPPGKHAYLQLNTQVFRLVRKGGGVVSCSCSGLLEEEDFLGALSKAAARNQVGVRWIGRGAPAADHPMLAEFPEGRYLKCWVGISNA